MKYRVLTIEELKNLEKEFIEFLASNTITASDWEKLKNSNKIKAEKLIELFSDIVFDKVLVNVQLLEIDSTYFRQYLKFNNDEVEMRGILIENAPDFNLAKIASKNDLDDLLRSHPNASIKILKGTKKYSKNREEEIFDWIKKGALISQSMEIFESLKAIE